MAANSEQQTLDGDQAKTHNNPDYLRELYHDKRMTQKEIGDKLGVTQRAIQYRFNKYGIDTRSRSEQYSRTPVPQRVDHEGYRRWRHQFRNDSHEKIEQTVAVHRLAAVAWFGLEAVTDMHIHHKSGKPWDNRESNLEVLTPSEHAKLHANQSGKPATKQELIDRGMIDESDYTCDIESNNEGKSPENADYLRKLYHNENMTQQKIADKIGVSQSTIDRRMKKYDIETRPGGHSPE